MNASPPKRWSGRTRTRPEGAYANRKGKVSSKLGRRSARRERPGLVGVAARTAVAAGTASAVSGRVARHQAECAAAQHTVPDADTSAQAPSGPPAPSGLTDAEITDLDRIGKLHDEGVLSDEEFAVQKDRILRS